MLPISAGVNSERIAAAQPTGMVCCGGYPAATMIRSGAGVGLKVPDLTFEIGATDALAESVPQHRIDRRRSSRAPH